MAYEDNDVRARNRGVGDTAATDGPPPDFEARFESEQLRLITAQLDRLPVVMLVINAFIAWLVWRADRPHIAIALFAISAAYDLYRFALCAAERRQPSTLAHRRLRQLSYAFVGAAALRIVPIPLLFDPRSIDLQVLYTMVCVGLAAGGVATAGGVFRAYTAWAIVVGGALALAWMVQGGFERSAVGALVALMFVTLALYSRDQGRTLRRFWELVHLNETLAASLRVERDRAELASQSKTRFFAAASHDLRQPLHALSINATTLELVAMRQPDPLIRELSGSITRALRQSNELLDALLDISQLDAQVVETRIESVDSVRLVESLREEFAATATQRGLSLALQLRVDVPPVYTDERQLRRLLGNLLANALKFTRQGGVTITVETESDAQYVVISVVDTGPGIPVQEQERVFEDFYQIGNASRDRSLGLGLGLSIVRRTAALIGAQVRLESAPGFGCRFHVRLRRAQSSTPIAQPIDADAVRRHLATLTPRVLAIDDEADILASLARLLPHFGCTVHCAIDLASAERALEDGFRPDLLMVDHRLKGTTGSQVIAALRERCGPVPSVIVTGDTLPRPTDDGMIVVHKPIDGQLLAQAMFRALTPAPGVK